MLNCACAKMLIQQPITMEGDAKMEHMMTCERQTSLRRRKNGAFLRPNLIDVVGKPKFKPSDTSNTESESELRDMESVTKGHVVNETGKVDSGTNLTAQNSVNEEDEKICENNNGKLKEDYVRELDNLTTLLRSLIVKEFEVSPDESLEETDSERSKETEILPEIKRKRSQSEKEIRFGRCIEWEDDEDDHVMIQLPLTPQKEKRSLSENNKLQKCMSRSRSLPETKRGKSKLSGLLNFGKGRRSNSANNEYTSSDGEGSGQSMMSFGSNSSSPSIGRRSRSGSLLSRSRTCSSPMSDKRSRAGSLLTNKTGCPQYFIPGENRGRIFMEPLDLFQTQTVCIKGISLKIMKDMPRTHRAMSMIGCMGFIVPAPSRYFER